MRVLYHMYRSCFGLVDGNKLVTILSIFNFAHLTFAGCHQLSPFTSGIFTCSTFRLHSSTSRAHTRTRTPPGNIVLYLVVYAADFSAVRGDALLSEARNQTEGEIR